MHQREIESIDYLAKPAPHRRILMNGYFNYDIQAGVIRVRYHMLGHNLYLNMTRNMIESWDGITRDEIFNYLRTLGVD